LEGRTVPKIHKIKTFHCSQGTSDKVYGIVILRADNQFYSLVTFYGPRGKVLNQRIESTSQSTSGLYEKFIDIANVRARHGYVEVDWRDTKYGMKNFVQALGTLPGEDTPESSPAEQPAVAPVKPKPATKSPKPTPSLGRSLEERDFI
jgi:hypothetical protein